MSVCDHCTFGLEVMGIISQCSWQQLRKKGSGVLAEHLSLNLHFLPHPASCSAPKSISGLDNVLLTQMFAFYSWSNLRVFPSCGMLAAHGAQACSKCCPAGEEISAPFPLVVPAAAGAVTGKKCIGLWLLSLMGRAISCKALLWPFSNWERLENSLAAACTGLSCLTDWTRWTVSLRSSSVLPANFFSVLNDFYSTFWAAPVNLVLSSSCDLTQFPGEWSVKVQLAFPVC